MSSTVPNLKYKTTLCNSWREEKPCPKADVCFFAHGPNQIRTIDQNQQSMIEKNRLSRSQQESSQDGSPSGNYKTVLCKFYQKGECQLGEHCTYIHETKQRRQYRQPHSFPKRSFSYNQNPSKIPTQLYPNQEMPLIQSLSWHEYSDLCWMAGYQKLYQNSQWAPYIQTLHSTNKKFQEPKQKLQSSESTESPENTEKKCSRSEFNQYDD